MIAKIEEGIDLGDGHLLRPLAYLQDFVSRTDLAFLYDSEIKSRSAMGDEQGRHLRVVHPHAHAVAGNPRLRDFEHCAANAKAVTDANFTVCDAVHGQILPKL